MQIDVSFDSSVQQAPTGFRACINAVCQYYDTLFTNNFVLNISVGWGEVGGQALSPGSLGNSSFSTLGYDYATVRNVLSAVNATGAATLPATSPAGNAMLQLSQADARLLGLTGSGGSDGAIGFSATNFSFNPTQSGPIASNLYDFVGTVEHEISEVMGRTSAIDGSGNNISIIDLYRYQGAGVRQLTTGDPSYFSLDRGVTNLAAWNNTVTGDANGDLGDWAASVLKDSYDADGNPGEWDPVSAVDKTLMQTLGYTVSTAPAADSVAAAIPTLTAAAAQSSIAAGTNDFVSIADSAADVAGALDQLQTLASNGNIDSIGLTDGGTPILAVSVAQISADALALADITSSYKLAVSGSSGAVVAALASLQTLAAASQLSSITLSDGGIPTLTVSTAQAVSDALALGDIASLYTLTQTVSGTNLSIAGVSSALGNSVAFSGNASQFTVTAAGDGVDFTVANAGSTDHLSHVQSLIFSDVTEIVAPTPGSNGIVTGGNITELYGAVFGRIPDVPGLTYYENALAANPKLSLGTLAENFLQSPEYTGNSAHNYAQTTLGEQQFITDSYNNLLHRAPESGAIPYYQNLIGQFTQGVTPGTAAYATAELQAHATVLVDFSASAEFLGDVQVTAATPASSGFTGHWLVLI